LLGHPVKRCSGLQLQCQRPWLYHVILCNRHDLSFMVNICEDNYRSQQQEANSLCKKCKKRLGKT
jgi:hypothetical protein